MSESRSSRIRGLYKLDVYERIRELERLGWLSNRVASDVQHSRQVLTPLAADKMIENVIGVFGLPLAIAPNFIVNNRDYLVPLVVEEPSIVAALSNAAALARPGGGFRASCDESLLVGQIHVTNIADIDASLAALASARENLIDLANSIHPRLQARGGGVRDCEFRALELSAGRASIVVHLLVDTCDAMGANLVNTICEAVAPKIETLCGGTAVLRILSNLVDRSLVRASVMYVTESLVTESMSAAEVRDRIVQASEIAIADPHRATTHNKGIMNGIDPLAIATGNDWRAIEAGAHAYAARNGHYSALTRWTVGDEGELCGYIEIPVKVGVVGGTLHSNPAAELGLSIAGTATAKELAELMAAVGLAQNFSALRALATQGIQSGHMRLHARSVVAGIGVSDERMGDVVEALVASGEIKSSRAREIAAKLDKNQPSLGTSAASAAGKIILLGEHAVVYGRRALALPIENAVRAIAVESTAAHSRLKISSWSLNVTIDPSSNVGVDAVISCILRELAIVGRHFTIEATSMLPHGMGLGSSAAFAVAITRAVAACCGIDVDDKRINEIAFECEKLAHGTPSGIDNTIACYGEPILFRRTDENAAVNARIDPIELAEAPPLVVALSHEAGPTSSMVVGVRSRFNKDSSDYNALFDQIDSLSARGAEALMSKDYRQLGRMMNICQGLLNAIEVSTPDLERMIAIARRSGAVGAKLTGAGGGGAIVALCPGEVETVRAAFVAAGYATLPLPESTPCSN